MPGDRKSPVPDLRRRFSTSTVEGKLSKRSTESHGQSNRRPFNAGPAGQQPGDQDIVQDWNKWATTPSPPPMAPHSHQLLDPPSADSIGRRTPGDSQDNLTETGTQDGSVVGSGAGSPTPSNTSQARRLGSLHGDMPCEPGSVLWKEMNGGTDDDAAGTQRAGLSGLIRSAFGTGNAPGAAS
eukprot:CAMPEP_0114172088 /NCGR_PEP_ID=MMETSP0043_2-20121206/35061_1 /TAXON_ID=464988 /ORGANISM="Hemiselmis andersenii, Strain CCMP644" /LENGTH=181 /DNA_ID=CAMNT_0001269885 /DNA_START=118 /DNA_END=660 /DNA_ORIENTATION=-